MSKKQQYQFISGLLAWMLAGFFLLLVTEWFTYERLFILSFVGLLIVTALTTTIHIRPSWRRRVRWMVFVGLTGFLAIIGRRTADILGGT